MQEGEKELTQNLQIQKRLGDIVCIEKVVRSVSIACSALSIPISDEAIVNFIKREGQNILQSEKVYVAEKHTIHTTIHTQLTEKDLGNIWRNTGDSPLVGRVVRSISQSFEDILSMPISNEAITYFIEQECKEILKATQNTLIVSQKLNKKDLEKESFRVDSTEWRREEVLSDGTRIKINPEGDITEILDGEFKGEQHFIQDAAIRETQKAGKTIPSKENWRSILQSINPDIDLDKYIQYDTTIYKALKLKLPGYHYGATGAFKNQGTTTYLWTSSHTSDFGYYVVIGNKKIESINSTDRKNFFSVLCLK